MARYILVEVDDNRRALSLKDKLGQISGVRVVGMFTRATQLCECGANYDTSVIGARFGWRLCPGCRKPKQGGAQTLYNMLDDPDTPSKYRNLWIGVRWVLRGGVVHTLQSVPKENWK